MENTLIIITLVALLVAVFAHLMARRIEARDRDR